MLLRIMLPILFIALLGGCETMTKQNISNDMEECSKSYNKMIRWRELDMAGAVFAPKELQEEFSRKVQAAKNVTVTDFRVKNYQCSPEKGEATVIIDIDYYREPSVTLKTVEDTQQWKYVQENETKRWRLMTLPPDFP
ncbi:MAG: hypothetical protein EG824_09925 [Deltaproteobacteria bacterium]|nr:hypothetical protein [Deltaproteobacteria bacterium]